ncbi:sensor histidine kinase [Yinghuangia seranimata]|uniref:sensor histidine kinase n=1 Tax=Yinghuangia seranimata TaxID=408067 RepID=UPI00248B7828|nr:histidine kinase [Yinghuangia seranimata]MDI2126476.1 histidine kinase [Yinghuangia seranimata]
MSVGGRERAQAQLPRVAAAGIAVSALAGVVTAGPLVPLPAVVGLSAAVVLATRPGPARRWTAVAAGLAALVSVAVTPVLLAEGGVTVPIAVWGVGEAGALLALTVLVARYVASLRQAAAAVAALCAAEAGLMVRVVWPEALLNMVFIAAYWSLGAGIAVVVGLCLRSTDAARARSVAAARRIQRLELARDLHDFVAHDVTGMVVQAQAAAHVLAGQPEVGAALKRIEEAGQRALASMDRTVHMLRDTGGERADDPVAFRVPTLADLPVLVARFADAGPARPVLRVDHAAAAAATRETATTAYRVVTEALTNIRRHAPAATRVEIGVGGDPPAADDGGAGPRLVVTVTNDRAPAGRADAVPARQAVGVRRNGGLGLVGLAERVEALGGTLTAGPAAAGTWQVTALFPMSPPRV